MTSENFNARLAWHEQKGTLRYIAADGEWCLIVGEFYVSGPKVIARRKGGRNRWHLCNISAVTSFELGRGWS